MKWLPGSGRWYSDHRGYFIAEVYGGPRISFDAWALSKPSAQQIPGAPFESLELAQAACEAHASDALDALPTIV